MKIYFSFALFLLFVAGCRPGNNDQEQPASNADSGLPEGFSDFYKRFHRDSLYQIDHITFPLQGVPDFSDSLSGKGPFYWEREDWIMHRELDLEKEGFTKNTTALGYMVEEVIRNKDDFGTIRRFYLIDDEWKLIYYVGINHLPQ